MDPKLLDEIEVAYQGEIYGEALYEGIAAAQTDAGRAWKWRVLAQMERETAALVAALLARLGRRPEPDPAARVRGEVEARDYGAMGWEALMRRFHVELETDVAAYGALAARGVPDPEGALARLWEHEVVTRDFCARELDGAGPASLAPVLALVAAPPPRP